VDIAANYLVVELETDPTTGQKQVWVNPNHISFRSGDGCTTDPTTGKCRFVWLCNFETVTYYMQVGLVASDALGSDQWHRITVSALKANVLAPISDTTTTTTLATNFNEIVIVQADAIGSVDGNPLSPLQFYYSTGSPVDTWYTYNTYGDPRCAESPQTMVRSGVYSFDACRLHQATSGSSASDLINFHFIREPTETCVNSQLSISKSYIPSAVPITTGVNSDTPVGLCW